MTNPDGRREFPPGMRMEGNHFFPILGILVLGLLIFLFWFIWFECRIQVDKGELVPLLKKTGKNMTNDMVLAPAPEYRGPQVGFLKEGRHFNNPWYYSWPQKMKAIEVEPGKVMVLVRKYGDAIPPDQVIAVKDNEKGILEKVFAPGRYYISQWEYDTYFFDMVKIEPGYRGIVTLMVGKEPENPNVFVVKKGERGTQPYLLPAGTHPDFSNPYIYKVTPIDVRSQKFELSGKDSFVSLSRDGVDVNFEVTIEWAPDINRLPEVFVKFIDEKDLEVSGGINNIQEKVILPYARSFIRTVSGKHKAVDYITGDTKIQAQNDVEKYLREACANVGLIIRGFVIRKAEPDQKIRTQYERREMAKREIDRYEKEIETEIGSPVMEGGTPKLGADGKPELNEYGKPVLIGGKPRLGKDDKPLREGGRLVRVIEQRRKDREGQFGTVRQGIAKTVRDAEQYYQVEVTKAEKNLAIAKIQLEAAKDTAAKTLAEGNARAAVIVMENKAKAQGVKAKVSAFGSGDKYAENQLILKFAPGISVIMSNTDEGPFSRLFERFTNIKNDTEKNKK